MQTSFPLFSRLPPEIRRLIWRRSWKTRVVVILRGEPEESRHDLHETICPREQFVHQSYDELFRARRGLSTPGINGQTATYTHTSLPVSLFVNRESRNETLFHYSLAFRLPHGESRVYFNFAVDIPAVMKHHMNILQWSADVDKVEALVIMGSPMVGITYTINYTGGKAEEVPSLLESVGVSTKELTSTCPNIKRLHFSPIMYEVVDPWQEVGFLWPLPGHWQNWSY